MEVVTCTRCGAVVDGEGIRHRRRLFCSDECCEEFEDQFLDHGEPDDVDLEDDDPGGDGLYEEDDDLYDDDTPLDDDDY